MWRSMPAASFISGAYLVVDGGPTRRAKATSPGPRSRTRLAASIAFESSAPEHCAVIRPDRCLGYKRGALRRPSMRLVAFGQNR